MRTGHEDLTDLINQPKEVGLSATFRKTLPVFSRYAMTNSIGLTDPAWIDACNWLTGILRVTSVGNVLYTQYIPDIHAAWPTWSNTGIALYPGSRPAVDAGYVWYQMATNEIRYRYYGTWSSEGSASSVPGAAALAPIGTRCYAIWQRNAGAYEILARNGQDSSQYTIYGLTSMPRIDAVSFGGKEYFYTMDRDAARVIEIKHAGNAVSGADNYGVGRSVVPIDAIDEVYGLKLGYASVIDNKVVVTGRLTRTSDDAPVSFDVYAAGPENFSFGREMFIHGEPEVMGKMLRVGNEFIVSGATCYHLAQATTLFGGTGHPDLQVTTSEFSNIALTEAESRSANLDIDMSPDASHPAIAAGSEVELEMAYNDNWINMATCIVDLDRSGTEENGRARIVSGVGKSAERVAAWSPDQGVYIPSQAIMYDNPANMTKVIRATGKWESTDPEDATAPVKLNDLNKLGVLYSTARASRGGAMRGKFSFPPGTYFKPYYGVAVNYYRETAAEAAGRLGVEINDLEDDMFGHNGIVAIYSGTEHAGASGIGLYLWKDSVMTKLASMSLFISANVWHWLQIEFIEGEIRVKYRLDSDVLWTECITFMYNSTTLPWKRETLGRGAILVKNLVPEVTCYPVGPGDFTLGTEDHSAFPTTGTLRVDDEQMVFTSKSTVTAPANWVGYTKPPGWNVSPRIFWPNNNAFKSADKAGFYDAPKLGVKVMATAYNGEETDYTPFAGFPDHSFIGLALVTLSGGVIGGEMRSFGTGGRTFRVLDFDDNNISAWIPNDWQYPSGWQQYINDGSKGAWGTLSAATIFANADLHHIFGFSENPLEDPGPSSEIYRGAFALTPAFHITTRGANGTLAITHGVTKAQLDPGKSVFCSIAASFTQEEDQSVEDALEIIVGMAGGKAACKTTVDETHVFASANVVQYVNDHKNLICEMEVPPLVSLNHAGVVFRAPGLVTMNGTYPSCSTGGYYLAVERTAGGYYLALFKLTSTGVSYVERVPIHASNTNGAATAHVPAGTLKVSVQDSCFSAWLNGRYLHTFYHTEYADGLRVGFVSGQASTFHIHLSELDDLLADIVVGTRGNGMSVIGELLGDRHILWRDEPDGSLFFYKTRTFVGDLPDIVSAVSDTRTDAMITRMRAEGLLISEIYDVDLLRDYGNTFATVNARHANNVSEARAEARLLIDEAWRNAFPRRYIMDVHPGLQPGDAINFGELTNIVRSQSITIGFAGNNFVCEMQCDAIPYARE